MVDYVPHEVLTSVHRLEVGNQRSTCFTIRHADRCWLVSARHCLEPFEGEDATISTSGGSAQIRLENLVYSEDSQVDIGVIPLSERQKYTSLVTPASSGFVLSQQAFFLGFPLGLVGADVPETGGLLPFVKVGFLAGMNFDEGIYYLDGHNNPGFSGGPVCFKPPGLQTWQIAGVVSGYPVDPAGLASPGGGHVPGVVAKANSGIVVTYSIEHVKRAIDSWVLG